MRLEFLLFLLLQGSLETEGKDCSNSVTERLH